MTFYKTLSLAALSALLVGCMSQKPTKLIPLKSGKVAEVHTYAIDKFEVPEYLELTLDERKEVSQSLEGGCGVKYKHIKIDGIFAFMGDIHLLVRECGPLHRPVVVMA